MKTIEIHPLPQLIDIANMPTPKNIVLRKEGTDFTPLIAMYERVLQSARTRRSRPDEASALADLGKFCLQAADPRRALTHLDAAVVLFRELRDTEREGLALELCAMAQQMLGDLPAARAAMARALVIAEEGQNDELAAARQNALGGIYSMQHDARSALPFYQKAEKLAGALHMDALLTTSLSMQGQCHLFMQQMEPAATCFRRAVESYQRLGDVAGENTNRARLATVLVALGREAEGMQLMEAAIAPLRLLGQWFHVRGIAENLGTLQMNAGRHDRAVATFELELEALDRCGGQGRGLVLQRIGMAAQLARDPARARKAYEEALPILEKDGPLRELVIVQANHAVLFLEQGQPEAALPYLERAAATAARVGDADLVGPAKGNLGLTCLRLGRVVQGLAALREAVGPLQAAGDHKLLAIVQSALARHASGGRSGGN